VILEDGTRTGLDLGLLALDGKDEKRTVTPLVNTPFKEDGGEISPDGRWLAYESNESGPNQIYVRPFPNVDSGHWQVSTAGGSRPAWARNGKELLYVDAKDSVLMSVPVQTGGPIFSAGAPAKVFDSKMFTASNGRTYDVSPDGQRFLLIKDGVGAGGAPTASTASMVVVLNWLEELKARTR
jgi:serine/threonine-protein kinase